jgi:flagellar basal body-associated protein FliL
MAEESPGAVESEKKESGEEAGAAAPAKGTGKSTMIIVIVVALLVVIMTPLLTFLVIKQMAPAPVVNVPKQELDPSSQVVLPLKAITVNIADTKGTRILRFEAHLVLSEAKLEEEMKKVTAMLSDRAILAASRKTIDELEGAQGLESLKRDIMSAVNASIKGRMSGAVTDVYFSEFLIQ